MSYTETTNRYNIPDEYLDLNLHLCYMVDDFEDLSTNDCSDETQTSDQGG